ncbi:unnamed protein product [Ostreobium quekettii]|uniref:Uncharacterized protein n=1 Tax=Ostreobium quekettii TaxID=121088 RepID=A0A8S1IL12_9CHLO|nr:unnamed protein product [Ostreobium quekettii]
MEGDQPRRQPELPDVYPLRQGCPEDTLTPGTLKHGYQESAEAIGVPETKEAALSLAADTKLWGRWKSDGHRKTLWNSLRAVQEKSASKDKAGKQYGVPLSGASISKDVSLPQERPVEGEHNSTWLLNLSNPLHAWGPDSAILVPNGRPQSLIASLAANQVALPQASSLLQVTYLSQAEGAVSPVDHRQCSSLLTKDLTQMLGDLLPQCMQDVKAVAATAGTPVKTDDLRPSTPQSASSPASAAGPKGAAALQAGSPEGSSLDASRGTREGPPGAECFGFQLVGDTGQRLEYLIRLTGWLTREGLVDVGSLADWVLDELQGEDLPVHGWAVLIPLLEACLPDAAMCQDRTKRMVSFGLSCASQLQEQEQREGSEWQAQRLGRLKGSVSAIMQRLVETNPGALVGLDTVQQLTELKEKCNIDISELQACQAKLTQAVGLRCVESRSQWLDQCGAGAISASLAFLGGPEPQTHVL